MRWHLPVAVALLTIVVGGVRAQSPAIDLNPGVWELTFALDRTWVATGRACLSQDKSGTKIAVVHAGSYETCSQKRTSESASALDVTETCRVANVNVPFAFHLERQSPTAFAATITVRSDQSAITGRWIGRGCNLSPPTGPLAMVSGLRFTLANAPGPAPRPSAPSLPAAVAAASNGCTDRTSPTLQRQTEPSYTADAMRAKLQGVVELEAVIDKDGKVGDVGVMKSLDAQHGLDFEAVKCVKRWQFTPATCNGQPVPMLVALDISFRLH